MPGTPSGAGLFVLGRTLPAEVEPMLKKLPPPAWTPAYDADDVVRPGA